MIRKITRSTAAAAALALLLFASRAVHADDLITCGWDEVRGLRINQTNSTTLWIWKATNSNLPEPMKGLFATTADAKPCPGGNVLIASSGGGTTLGGVALVNPATSNALFYAVAPNAHSADLLPSNRVAVALSYHTNGNRLAIFDLATNDVELFTVPLWGAHGVVWDPQREILWGMADYFIAGYKLTNWNSNPQLVQVSWTGIPDGGGHDMYPVPNSPSLLVTTDLHAWYFHRDTLTFTKHPILGDVVSIKGISIHPTSGRTVYVTADGPWWSEHLRFLSPSNTLDFSGDHFYKARWIPPVPPPQLAISFTPPNTAKVHWPSTWTNYVLQQKNTLDTTNWVAPVEPVGDDGTNRFIMVSPAAGGRFYRLLQTQ